MIELKEEVRKVNIVHFSDFLFVYVTLRHFQKSADILLFIPHFFQ